MLISDIELPDGSGLDLMRDAGPMPGIALSGFGSEEDVHLSESAGFALHLTKPVDLRTLEASIARLAPPTGSGTAPRSLSSPGPDGRRPRA